LSDHLIAAHGGGLVDLLVDAAGAAELKAAAKLPPRPVSTRIAGAPALATPGVPASNNAAPRIVDLRCFTETSSDVSAVGRSRVRL
jgi:hypothetical protein